MPRHESPRQPRPDRRRWCSRLRPARRLIRTALLIWGASGTLCLLSAWLGWIHYQTAWQETEELDRGYVVAESFRDVWRWRTEGRLAFVACSASKLACTVPYDQYKQWLANTREDLRTEQLTEHWPPTMTGFDNIVLETSYTADMASTVGVGFPWPFARAATISNSDNQLEPAVSVRGMSLPSGRRRSGSVYLEQIPTDIALVPAAATFAFWMLIVVSVVAASKIVLHWKIGGAPRNGSRTPRSATPASPTTATATSRPR